MISRRALPRVKMIYAARVIGYIFLAACYYALFLMIRPPGVSMAFILWLLFATGLVGTVMTCLKPMELELEIDPDVAYPDLFFIFSSVWLGASVVMLLFHYLG